MLVSAVFTPHPPLIIPEIGEENIKEVKATVSAMEKLGQRMAEADPDLVLIISPHGLIHQTEMSIGSSPKMIGDFANFDHPEIGFSFSGDMAMADQIIKDSLKERIPSAPADHDGGYYFLDHGALVPLYYLTAELGMDIKIIPIGYSMLSRSQHFVFGQTIGKIIDKSLQRIAVVASGDLSHRLLENGSSELGSQFDRTLVENIKNYDPAKIVDMDEEMQEAAGECGYRSLLILLGILDGRDVYPEVLSYEGPFGVGYMVADFKLNN